MQNLIINAAVTGMIPRREDSPFVPLTPREIAADVRRCAAAGASIVHLHARDAQGAPTWSPEVFAEILERVHAAAPEIVLCVSTSGRDFPEFEKRSAALGPHGPATPAPEMASLTLGSLNFPGQASVTTPAMIAALATRMGELGITPELECFEIGMVELIGYLLRKSILRRPVYTNLLLGNRGTLGASEDNLRAMVAALPRGATWAAAGIGRFQLPVNQLAIESGGHVRVGLEDNLWFDEARRDPASNPRLVERLAGFARSRGREIASPEEARRTIGLGEPALVQG
jgi:uncharacterized protein (DUF849 family)